MAESEQTTIIDNRGAGMPGWLKWIMTIGLGGVIGWQAFQYFLGADRASRDFVQGQLIEALTENTAASSSLKETSVRVENVLGKVEDELDDFSKATVEQNKRIDRLIERQWQAIGEDQQP